MCEKVPKDVTHSLGVLACALEGNVSSVTLQSEALSVPAQGLHVSFFRQKEIAKFMAVFAKVGPWFYSFLMQSSPP